MGRAQALSHEDYIPYEGPRVAGFSPEQLGAQGGYKALAQRGMPLMDQAGQIATMASQGAPLMAESGYQAGPIQSQYGGSNITNRFGGANVRSGFGGMPIRSGYQAGPIQNQYQAGPIQSTYAANRIRSGVQGFSPQEYLRAGRGFDSRDAQQYMSPYLENVMNRQQKRTLDRFQEGKAARNAQAIKSGAFGGSRQAIGDFLARRDMNEKLGDIEAQQLEKGFGQSQQQFERDRAARMSALQGGDTGQLALAKQRTAEQVATEDAKRQAAAQNLQAQIAQQKAFEAAGGQSLQAQMAQDKARQAQGSQSLQAQIAQMKGLSDADQRRIQAQIAEGKFGQAAGDMDLRSQVARDKSFSTANAQNLQAQIAADRARQAQGSQSLQAQLANQKAVEAAYQRALKGSGVLSGLTKTEQDLDLSRLGALSNVGAQRQAMMQKAYDTQYEDFIRQKEYPYEQLERYNAMLQGLPVTPSYTKSFYSPAADPTAQLVNTGIGMYGAGRGLGMFGGGGG